MLVETFECDEMRNEHPEISNEAKSLIEKLGLEGQQTLVGKSEHGMDIRCPYRQMTADEHFVYKQICPDKTTLEKYDGDSIPLRVLQVAAHARELDIFTTIEVWHVRNPMIKDPILVGVQGKEFIAQKFFALARWGEALDEWPAMVKAAMTKWKADVTEKLAEIRAEVETDLAKVEKATLSTAVKKSGMPVYYR